MSSLTVFPLTVTLLLSSIQILPLNAFPEITVLLESFSTSQEP